ncbi:MAG: DUF362 domain-containing protein [Fibrobacteres bacterium]|nr:DUF362 domain-containing protein [Fibrobacterota bacterium]
MLCQILTKLTGTTNDSAAWNLIFSYYNNEKNGIRSNYSPGEKIMIKPNFVGFTVMNNYGGVDSSTYNLISMKNYMNTSPQLLLALLRQLVNVVHVNPSDIYVGDPTTFFPNEYYNYLHNEFQNVNYVDNKGKFGRTKAISSNIPIYWSCRPSNVIQDYIPMSYTEATYLINVANFKSHILAGVTLGAKNHFGSLIRLPVDNGYYNLHNSLPANNPAEGQYRVLVDLLGHIHLGGKTILSLVDGLYAGVHDGSQVPRRWNNGPFKNDWTSSIFASQDPIALESVLFDLMQLEGESHNYPKMPGVDDYLREAALADNPPSGTFYDPNNVIPTKRLSSLGVTEHWNNPTQMKYSRNLGTGNGIELLYIDSLTISAEYSKQVVKSICSILPYHNPFNVNGQFKVAFSKSSNVTVSMYDISGNIIRNLYTGPCSIGLKYFSWNGCDNSNRMTAAGVYFFSVKYTNGHDIGIQKARIIFQH